MSYKIKFLDGSEREFTTLKGADLRGAILRWLILRGVDLEGANLTGADLRGADLEGADLSGADLRKVKNILGFTLGKDFGFMVLDTGYVKIGCQGHSLEFWLTHYEDIGKENNYSELDIKLYGVQLKALFEMRKEIK